MRNPGLLLAVSIGILLSGNSFGQFKETVSQVTIKDAVPCTCYLATSVASLNKATSCDAANGSIDINVTGGSGSYNFSWTDQSGNTIATTRNVNNLLPGYYFVTVKDNNNPNCSGQGFFEVGSDLSIQFATETNTSCVAPSGSISAAVSGGSGSFSYQWTFPDGSKVNQQNIEGLKGGQYLLRVTDNSKGCVISKSTTVRNPTNLTVAVNGLQPNTSCLSPNGGIDVSVSGGSGVYAYYWYDVANGGYVSYTKDLVNIKPGQYSLYTIDQTSGCVAYEFFDIPDNAQKPQYIIEAKPNTRCGAPHDGSIALTLSGSPGPYSVTWKTGTNDFSNVQNQTGLSPGKYGFTATDNTNGCNVSISSSGPEAISIEDTSDPAVTIAFDNILDNTNCQAPDGSIDVSLSSTNVSNIHWTGPNGFTSESLDISGLSAGVYELRVTTSCQLVNHPPIIQEGPVTAQPNSQLTLELLTLISDPDGNLDVQSITILEGPMSQALWTLGDNLTLTIDYTESPFTGEDFIQVMACDLMGACTTQTLRIEVGEGGVIVFNAVSPHSTGDNKFMRILNLPESHNKVSIFNRWGDKVFETDGYNHSIPGKRFEGISAAGNELPSGTYFYKIEFSDGIETLTGYLALKQ